MALWICWEIITTRNWKFSASKKDHYVLHTESLSCKLFHKTTQRTNAMLVLFFIVELVWETIIAGSRKFPAGDQKADVMHFIFWSMSSSYKSDVIQGTLSLCVMAFAVSDCIMLLPDTTGDFWGWSKVTKNQIEGFPRVGGSRNRMSCSAQRGA